MRFNEFIEKQIKENSLIPLNELIDKITAKNEFNTDVLNNIINDQNYELLHIICTKPFKSNSFDLKLFYNLYINFKDIIENQRNLYINYKKQPKEFILLLYVYRINKKITEKNFFYIIQFILKKVDPYSFLNLFSFIADESLNNFVLSFIENKFSFKILSFFEKEDKKLLEIKSKIFIHYYDFQMVENCVDLITKNPSLVNHYDIQHLCAAFYLGLKRFNFNKDLNKIVILSYLIKKQDYEKFLKLLSLDIANLFDFKSFIKTNDDLSFSIQPIVDIEMENQLFIIYQNTILKYFDTIHTILHIELGMFFTLFHSKLNEEENDKILTILNKNLKNSFYSIDDYDLYNSFTYIPRFIHLSIINVQPVDLKQFLMNPMESIFLGISTTLCLDSESYPIFKESVNFDRFFRTLCYALEHSYTKDTELYKNCLIQHIYNLDHDLFTKLYNKYPNEVIIQHFYTKHLIKDF